MYDIYVYFEIRQKLRKKTYNYETLHLILTLLYIVKLVFKNTMLVGNDI